MSLKRTVSVILQAIGLLSVFVLLLGGTALYFASDWLVQEDLPTNADVIVLLAGDYSRPLYGADLHRQGYAPRIAVSRPAPSPQTENLRALGIHLPRQDDQFREILRRKGVPESAISVFGDGNLSTVQEAETLRTYLGARPVRLLVVTSPYHTRRVRAVFTRLLPQAEIRVLASPYEEFPAQWWRQQHAAINVLLETAKLLYYYLGGAFRAPPAAANTTPEPPAAASVGY